MTTDKDRIAALEAALDGLLAPFYGNECFHDHHGYCQAHFIESDCCVAKARAALAASRAAATEPPGDLIRRQNVLEICESHGASGEAIGDEVAALPTVLLAEERGRKAERDALSAEVERNAAIAMRALERAQLAEEWRDHDKARAIRAVLAASTPADPVTNAGCCQANRVKPLVWEDFSGRGAKAQAWNDANYMIQKWTDGRWEISASYPGYSTSIHGIDVFHPNLEAAKAAAQADYGARILAALDVQPITARQAAQVPEIAAMIEAANDRDGGAHDPDCRILNPARNQPHCSCGHVALKAALEAMRGME